MVGLKHLPPTSLLRVRGCTGSQQSNQLSSDDPLPLRVGAKMSESKPKRRWFQFSLRTLLIGTTLIAALVWWLAVYPEQQGKRFVELMTSDPDRAEAIYHSGMFAAMRKFEHEPPYCEPHPRSLWDKVLGRAVFTVVLPMK